MTYVRPVKIFSQELAIELFATLAGRKHESMSSEIRDLMSTWDGELLLGATCDGLITIWDLNSFKKKGEFQSVLSWGGRRLTITPDRTKIIAGAYHRHGVACYRASDGAILWQRKDIKRVQHLCFSYRKPLVFACFGDQAAQALSVEDGITVGTRSGVRHYYDTLIGNAVIFDLRPGRIELRSILNRTRKTILTQSTAVLDVTLAQEAFAISEMGASVRCFAVSDGREIWRYDPPVGSHILNLAYNPRQQCIMALECPYQNGGPEQLVCLDVVFGKCRGKKSVGRSYFAFCKQGAYLVRSDGAVFSTESGKIVHRMKFPKEKQKTPIKR